MTNITQVMVAPYFTAYLAKYGTECTLSLDVIEEIMNDASDEAAMLAAMHEAMQSSDEKDDRSTNTALVERDMTPGSAYSYAVKFDGEFDKKITILADAAIENKRGAAVIMLDLFRLFGEETVCEVWPVPGTYKPGNGGAKAVHAGDNEAWDKEDTSIQKEDGTTSKGVKSFYSDIVALSSLGHDWKNSEDAAKKVIGDVKASKPDASAAGLKIGTFKTAIARATNLAKRIAFLNNKTEVTVEVIKEADGSVKKSNKVLYIRNSKDASKFDIITIGQLLALKVVEGGTYAAITGTTQRASKSGTGPQEGVVPEVNSLDMFDKVTASYANFFDKLNEAINKKDMKAYSALLTRLNAAGSDDLLWSLNTIMNGIEAILSKPGVEKRLGALLADGKSKAA